MLLPAFSPLTSLAAEILSYLERPFHRFSIAAEPEILSFFFLLVFLVETWCLHYPQCNSTTVCAMLVVANVASGLMQRWWVGCRGLVSSPLSTSMPPDLFSFSSDPADRISSPCSHKTLYGFFHLRSSAPQDLWTDCDASSASLLLFVLLIWAGRQQVGHRCVENSLGVSLMISPGQISEWEIWGGYVGTGQSPQWYCGVCVWWESTDKELQLAASAGLQ